MNIEDRVNLIQRVEGGYARAITINAAELSLQDAALAAGQKTSVMQNSKRKVLNNAVSADFGSQIDLDTLSRIKTEAVKQKFYTAEPSGFLPVNVGFGAFSDNLIKFRNYISSGDFDEGIVGGSNRGNIPEVNTHYDSIRIPTRLWNKGMSYNILELNRLQANMGQAISLITDLEFARKESFDLGIQATWLRGRNDNTEILSLINQPDVTDNTTTITKPIRTMIEGEFNTLVSSIVGDYFANSNSTAMPDIFALGTSDFLGLGSPVSPTFPNITKLEYLEKTFKGMTGNMNFQIKPLAYLDAAQNDIDGVGKTRYVLYKNDKRVLEAHMPVAYTTTTADTNNNFHFQSVAYGQFSGVTVYRPKEMLYFSF